MDARLLPALRARRNPYPQHRLQHQYLGHMLRRSPLSAAYFPASPHRPDYGQRRLYDRSRRHAHYGHGYCRLRFEGNLRQASCLSARRPAARRISRRPVLRSGPVGCGIFCRRREEHSHDDIFSVYYADGGYRHVYGRLIRQGPGVFGRAVRLIDDIVYPYDAGPLIRI